MGSIQSDNNPHQAKAGYMPFILAPVYTFLCTLGKWFNDAVELDSSVWQIDHVSSRCLPGAVYAGIAASERIFSAKSTLRIAQEKSEMAEVELKKIELQTIQKTADHAENERIKAQEEETETLDSEAS